MTKPVQEEYEQIGLMWAVREERNDEDHKCRYKTSLYPRKYKTAVFGDVFMPEQKIKIITILLVL